MVVIAAGFKGLALLACLGAFVGVPLFLLMVVFKPFLDEEDRRYFEARDRAEAERNRDRVRVMEHILARTNPALYESYMRDKERSQGQGSPESELTQDDK